MEFLRNILQIISNRPDYWLFLFWLPVFLALWAVSARPAGRALLQRLNWTLPALGLLMLAIFAWFNWVFLRSPLYLGPWSHIQPQIADISWYFATGRPVYHGPDSPEIYNLLYGPWLYIVTGAFEKFLTPSIFSAKLPGTLAIAVGWIMLFLLLRKKAGGVFACLGSGLLAALLMALDPVEILTRADAYILCFLVIGCWAAQSSSKTSPWLFGLMAGLCFNFKIHAPVYFLPLLWPAWRAGHRGKSLAKAAASAMVVAVLPFIIFPNISLANYWWTLKTASGHGIDPFRLLQTLEWFFMLLLPIAAMAAYAYKQNPEATAQKLTELRPFLGLILAALILLLPFASKFGAGPHHLLPLLVILLFLAAELVPLLKTERRQHSSVVAIGLQATLLAWLAGCFAVGLTRSYQDTAWLNSSLPWAQAVGTDLNTILTKYGSSHVVLMGAGDEKDYMITFFRPKLVFSGMPEGIQPAALMEFAAVGKYRPDLNLLSNSLAKDYSGKKILWLVPKGNTPFNLPNHYTPVVRGDYLPKKPLFDESFTVTFKKTFHLLDSTEYYDVYANS